ncbi:MAG: outer membrane protein assembly factor BamE [Rhodospirillaceae bacterium]|nr:outer membrane protein assembly factor BamE [Rhodospirillaceae bacterium]
MMAPLTLFRMAVALTGLALLGACAKDIDARGNLPPPDAIAKLAPGEQTRQDVQNLLGTPATTAVFDNETWYYISGQTTQYAFYATEELERTVYAVSFDQRGILEGVRKIDQNGGRDIQIAGRETPTKGRELSIIEQLIGNLGRFNSGKTSKAPQ